MKPTLPAVHIIGAGPAGLMAAEVLSRAGLAVHVHEAMPSVARKFLRAGVGGLNLTHAEDFDLFLSRYRQRQAELAPLLAAFGPTQVRAWAEGLGIATFVGSSGRVFPVGMKASPLLRAWLQRLQQQGVHIHLRQRWLGWDQEGALRVQTPTGEQRVPAQVCILALGGGSWAKLGSDGAWWPLLQAQGIAMQALQPANGGFVVNWSAHFRSHQARQPLKTIVVRFVDAQGLSQTQRGEMLITEAGIEGSLVYALSAAWREALQARGELTLYLDLLPDKSLERVQSELEHGRGSRSIASHLQSRTGLKGVKTALLWECLPRSTMQDMVQLARAIKALPVVLQRCGPIDQAISTAGGVDFAALTPSWMLRQRPGVFCAGEMLDWEAPTGGYLLTACLSSGHWVGQQVLHWLQTQQSG